jgi:tRNA pseudouridine55 synthase
MQGLLLVDKPQGISSFGVVAKVRWLIKQATGQKIKVGHSGTLDPAATGLLVLAIGPYTKKIPGLIKHDKTYLVEMTLGKTSSTGDKEGEINVLSGQKPSTADIKSSLEHFTGVIEQVPPIYSAIKIGGQRAYDLARKGKIVELPSRQVTIYSNRFISYEYPVVVFETDVSSGTYIRSLVEDMGKYLGVGAYTSNLRRLSVGEYQVGSALQLDGLDSAKITQNLITLVN